MSEGSRELISPRTAERRSPKALAHDPPVTRQDWTTGRELSARDFLDDARARLGLGDPEWDRLLRHAGIHVDRVRFEAGAPPERVRQGASVVAYCFEREPAPLALGDDAILLDGGGLVAVNKPPWWAAQGTRASRVVSLERELRRRLACPTLTPAHRLDRETSGVMLFAREGRVAGEIGRAFSRRRVRKEYLAIVAPPPERDAFVVEGRIVRIAHPSHSLFTLSQDEGAEGWPSRTTFETLSRQEGRALVRALPETGRTHQLRVHLVAAGSPIVGDSLYGGGWSPGQPWSAERLQLHAAALELDVGGRTLRVEAPLPADFELHGRLG